MNMVVMIAFLSILLCMFFIYLTYKINFSASSRYGQIFMPVIAVIFDIVLLIRLDEYQRQIEAYIQQLPLSDLLNTYPILAETFNSSLFPGIISILAVAAIAAVFLSVKLSALGILLTLMKFKKIREFELSLSYYSWDEKLERVFLNRRYTKFAEYSKGFYFALIIVLLILLLWKLLYPELVIFQYVVFSIFAIIPIGEMILYLSGETYNRTSEEVNGKRAKADVVANYGLMRRILRKAFGPRILFDCVGDNCDDGNQNTNYLDELLLSSDATEKTCGLYYQKLREGGKSINSNYARSSVQLMSGQSILFNNPFYHDLTDYLLLPMIHYLMRYQKCLIILGSESATEDVVAWIHQGFNEFANTEFLWKAEVISDKCCESEVGIIKFSDIYNLEILDANWRFLQEVGFVFLIEPSRIMATGQIGLSLIVSQCEKADKQIVYCACDRNSDGMVDALSHILKTNIIEVTATVTGSGICSHLYWNAIGPYMHHKILPDIAHYLGIGTEINLTALRSQISETQWISSERFPVVDMKWIDGQFYRKLCVYCGLPVSQEVFESVFKVEPNLWKCRQEDHVFLTVEDEFLNLFEMTRVYSSRAKEQGVVNVISEDYYLRDYMLDNVNIFLADPKAIPSIVPDFARTERNAILKLVLLMASVQQISDERVKKELTLCGLPPENELKTMRELITTHIGKKADILRKDEVDDNLLVSEVTQRWYSIPERSELYQYASSLKAAYFIAEDDQGNTEFIGSRLYGHAFQSFLPGQFITLNGKYYQVERITREHGIIVRRAADHISERRYYRQIRHYFLSGWQQDSVMGSHRVVNHIEFTRGFATLSVKTAGYLELPSNCDLVNAKFHQVDGIPERHYFHKSVLRILLPEANESVRYTICLILNEIFRSIYPDACQYISVLTPLDAFQSQELEHAMYTLEVNIPREPEPSEETPDADAIHDEYIYVLEDSDFDLGLIVSVERNLNRFLEFVCESLIWHTLKLSGQTSNGMLSPNIYEERCYLKYGSDHFHDEIDINGTIEYLSRYHFDRNPLQQHREAPASSAMMEMPASDNLACGYCGTELTGAEYQKTVSGLARCQQCSKTLLKEESQYEELYNTVLRNMQMFFGVQIHAPMSIKFSNYASIQRHIRFNRWFHRKRSPSISSGYLKNQKDGSVELYIENNLPRIYIVLEMVALLTYVWQQMNPNKSQSDVLPDWTRVQYLYMINEKTRASRLQYQLENDPASGQSFKSFEKQYPIRPLGDLEESPFN